MKVDARFRKACSLFSRSSLPWLVIVLTAFLAAPLANAQSTGGRIRGTVVDPSGGAVAAATVQLVNEATHASREVQSGANGEYIFIEVPVGTYEINLTVQGFKKYVRKGIVLDLNQVLTVDIALQLGGSTEVVEVTGAPPGGQHLFFNPASFQDSALGTFGNGPRALCCGPSISQSDISIEKKTPISERINTEFRAEFYNAVNHTQFLTPDGNFSHSATFGTVSSARDPRVLQFGLKFLF